MWVLGIELRSPGLTASVFIHSLSHLASPLAVFLAPILKQVPSKLPMLSLNIYSLASTSQVTEMTDLCHHAQLTLLIACCKSNWGCKSARVVS